MSVWDELRSGVITASAGATRDLGARLAVVLPPDTTLALHGDLGVGKTTFVQGLALGLGIAGPVTSPTFNVFHLYPGPRRLLHLDAYRLDGVRQMAELMIEDFLVPPYLLAVEWPDRIAEWLPADTRHLELGIEAPGRHRLVLR